MIYFIRSLTGTIKIGTTIRLSQRLKQLAVEHGQGLEVLAVLDGSFDTERALHARFAHLRQVGEWFEPGNDLMSFIVSDGKPWDRVDEVPPRTLVVTIRAGSEWEAWIDRAYEDARQRTGLGTIDRTDVIDMAFTEHAARHNLPAPPRRY